MLKFFFVFALTFFSISSMANQVNLKLTWFGATCVSVSDGKNSILFDPFFTRPSLWAVVSFKSLKSDSVLVKKWMSQIKSDAEISALITSHSHYDHVLDLVEVAKQTRADVYGSKSTKNIAMGGGIPTSRIHGLQNGQILKIGDFKIKVLRGSHPPHFLGLTLASGNISEPLELGASAYRYKKGEDFSFLIEHPEGNIFFHPSANSVLKKKTLVTFKLIL